MHQSEDGKRIVVAVLMNVATESSVASHTTAANAATATAATSDERLNSTFLRDLDWEHLPANPNRSVNAPNAVAATHSLLALNLMNALPTSLTYYAYTGSLTTPPCTENVEWRVLRHHTMMSQSQYNVWTRLFGVNSAAASTSSGVAASSSFNAHHHGNARPTQPLNGRNVTQMASDKGRYAGAPHDSQRGTNTDTVPPAGAAGVVPGVGGGGGASSELMSVNKDTFVTLCGLTVILALILVFALFFLCLRHDSKNRNLLLRQVVMQQQTQNLLRNNNNNVLNAVSEQQPLLAASHLRQPDSHRSATSRERQRQTGKSHATSDHAAIVGPSDSHHDNSHQRHQQQPLVSFDSHSLTDAAAAADSSSQLDDQLSLAAASQPVPVAGRSDAHLNRHAQQARKDTSYGSL